MQAANYDANWLGMVMEDDAFVDWACCCAMLRYSVALERKLEIGHKLN